MSAVRIPGSLPSADATIRIEEYDDYLRQQEVARAGDLAPDFAHLIPVNEAAKIAFDEVASLVAADIQWQIHCRKFIQINEKHETLNLGAGDDSDDSDDGLESKQILTGHYRLNLDHPPERFALGWVAGSGRTKLPNLGVDLLLSVNRQRDMIRGRHLRITHHPDSRVLMAIPVPGKKVLLNGEELVPSGKAIVSDRIALTIGSLTYRMEFLNHDSTAYNRRLDDLMRESKIWRNKVAGSFETTPSANHIELHGYSFQTPQAYGAFGIVSACIQIASGDVFAAKRVRRTRRSIQQVEDEVSVLKKLQHHDHVCCLVDVIYSDGDSLSMGTRDVNDVYMIINPWAPKPLLSLRTYQTDHDGLLNAFRQGAEGLSFIHSRGVIHRDIKPSNLLVAGVDPLRIVVADFGHATTLRNSQDHMKGTLAYLPPEIVDLKRYPEATGRWTEVSDVYSYGVVGFELFHKPFLRLGEIIEETVNASLVRSLQRNRTKLNILLQKMLSWDPDYRPTMDEVASNEIWPIPSKKRGLDPD